MSISLADQIACVEREIKMRQRHVSLVRHFLEKQYAQKELARMTAVLETLQKLDGTESLFPPEEVGS